MRKLLAAILVPVMKVTGFRFSKSYRWKATRLHALVYACVDTVRANRWAA